MFKSNFYGFYGLNGPFYDYFIKVCAVQKCLFPEIYHFFVVL